MSSCLTKYRFHPRFLITTPTVATVYALAEVKPDVLSALSLSKKWHEVRPEPRRRCLERGDRRSAACGASGATRGWATFYSFLELGPATCGVLGLPLLAIELGDHQFLSGPSVKAPSVDTEAVRV